MSMDEQYFKTIRLRVFALFLIAVWLFYETWGNY
jgi:cbb3-type cytochrome oxidase subunit 3